MALLSPDEDEDKPQDKDKVQDQDTDDAPPFYIYYVATCTMLQIGAFNG